MALQRITWTIDEFEDYPLIVDSGDKGTIRGIDLLRQVIQVDWDKDEYPKLPKGLNLSSDERFFCIVL